MAAQGKAAASGKSKAKAAGALRSWSAVAPPLADWIIEAVSHYGFDRMTPVQASTIPLFNGNKDVVVEAVTGSGKTLAFLIPIIERLLRVEEPIKRHHVGAIIISPTRELATQIHQVLLSLLAFHPPSAALLSAGENGPDEAAILPSAFKIIPQLLLGGQGSPALDLSTFLVKSPNLLIATPGRLLELLSSSHVHCPQSSFEVLVLDEADRLLDLGFKNDLQRILQRLPKQRRTGLFSASVSEAVDQLVRVGLRNPVRIAVKVRSRDGNEEQKVPASLQMTYLTVRPIERMCTLLGLVSNIQPQPIKSIAYLSTGAAVDYFTPLLPNLLSLIQMPSAKAQTIMIFGLHGKQSPAHREKQFRGFVESRSPALLLTTDVAARGLDISSVDLTIQLDPPSDPKTFLHRAGRAGRAGRRGLAIVFLLPGQETDGYPLFLAVRKTPVSPLIEAGVHGVEETLEACSTIAEKSISKLRSVVLGDRAIHDKAQRAFVSWVQSYAKHAASSIFRVANLPWSELAEAWALLKLPRMPELRRSLDGGETLDTTLGLSIDWTAYKYRDVLQERKRVTEQSSSTDLDREEARIKVQQSDGVAASHKRLKNLPWSNQLQRQEVSSARRAKRASVMRAKELSRMTESQRRDAEETERMLARVRAQQQSALP